MHAGLNLRDTAYAYGMGTSEKVPGEFLCTVPRDSYLISDKFTPQCTNPAAGTLPIIRACLKTVNIPIRRDFQSLWRT